MTAPVRMALVAAVADNGVIGADGTLPWRLPADLRRFRRLTLGKPVLMGRRTFESLPAPLAGRLNLVLTHRPETLPPGAVGVPNWDEALQQATAAGDWLYVIGGAALFAHALACAQRLYLTCVHDRPAGDVVFPAWDRSAWTLLAREHRGADVRHACAMTFCTFLRASPGGTDGST